MLLAIEGVAGAGKSAVRDRVLDAAASRGLPLGHIGQFSWLSLEATRTIVSLRAGRTGGDMHDDARAVMTDLELLARHNLAPALACGSVIADRFTLSSVCLLALLHHRPVRGYVEQLAKVTTARPRMIVLLTTPPTLCHSRLARRATAQRFADDPPGVARLAELYLQAATAWTRATGLPVLRHPCADDGDLAHLTTTCLDRLREDPQPPVPT